MRTAESEEGVELQKLVNRLVAEIVPATARHRSFIINDIPASMKLAANADAVTGVLSNLFKTMAAYSANSCIRITARTLGNVILLELKDQNSANTYSVAHSLLSAQPIAEKIGGYLGISSQRKNETTIVFSFPNLPLAA